MVNRDTKTPIFRIVLTGGPAGGKSTVQAMLSDVLENLGYQVYRVPETATILLGCGVKFADLDDEQQYNFQENLLLAMMRIEQVYMDLAASNWKNHGKKTAIIFDRGLMDPSAYVKREQWMQMIKGLNLNEVDMRDNRYDIAVHMVTAADGAEAFYSAENNATRSEGHDLARHLDSLVKHAWIGHPHYVVVDNSTDFERKCHRVIQAVLSRMGLDDKRWGKDIRKHKFLVQDFTREAEFPVPYRDFTVEHRYILSNDEGMQVRMRKRYDESGTGHYNLTTRHSPKNGQRVEERRSLGGREYDSLKAQTDPSRHVVGKTRRCFLYNNRYFQLDTFTAPCPGLSLLEAYLPAGDEQVIDNLLPPFVNVLREVTEDPAFSMYTLAKKNEEL